MTITCNVKPEWRERIAAVVHVDGSARPQIIERETNPLYYDILAAFERESGLWLSAHTRRRVADRGEAAVAVEQATVVILSRILGGCPLYPRKQRTAGHRVMSAKCQPLFGVPGTPLA